MTLTGAGNRWTDHVRAFAKQRNISYMCAMSDPDCSVEYNYKKAKAKGEAPKKPRGKKSKAPAIARESSAPLGDIYPEVEVQSISSPQAVRSVLKKKAEETKERSERGKMGAEDIISAAVRRATPVSAVPQAVAKKGRPRKYTSAEEAKKAKSQKTMEAAKKRKEAAKKRKEAKKAEPPPPPPSPKQSDAHIKSLRLRNKAEIRRLTYELKRRGQYDVPPIQSLEKLEDREKEYDRYEKEANKLYNLSYYYPADIEDIQLGIYNPLRWMKRFIAWDPPAHLPIRPPLGSGPWSLDSGPWLGRVDRKAGWVLPDDMYGTWTRVEEPSKVKTGRGRPRKAAQVEISCSRPYHADFGDANPCGRQVALVKGGIDRPANADFGDPLSGGRRRRRGIGAFFNAIGDAARVVNPMTYLISNKKTAKAMSDLGQVTNNNLLPAVVSVGKPLYDTAAVVGSTALTGNPILGKVAADSLFNRMAAPYDPRKRQTSPELKQLSEMTGNELAKYGKMAAAGGALLGMGYDMGYSAGASTIQKGIAAELRTYMPFVIRGALNNIAHSGDKYTEAGNEFVDNRHQPDEFAEDWLEVAEDYYRAMMREQQTGQSIPFIPLPPDTRADWEASQKRGKKSPPSPKNDISLDSIRADLAKRGKGRRLGADPHTWTPQGLPQY